MVLNSTEQILNIQILNSLGYEIKTWNNYIFKIVYFSWREMEFFTKRRDE